MFCQCPVCHRTTSICHENLDDDPVRCDHCHTMFIAPSPPTPDIAVPEWDDLASLAKEHALAVQVRDRSSSTSCQKELNRSHRRRHRRTLGFITFFGLSALSMLTGSIILLNNLQANDASSSTATVTTLRIARPPAAQPIAEASGELFPDVKAQP